MDSRDWYKTTARNNDCNDHPRQPVQLARDLCEYTGMSEENCRHLIDRLRHLAHCCREPETLTLIRMMPGRRQVRVEVHESATVTLRQHSG